MATHPPPATAAFSATLPFRPQVKRKWAGSLPRHFKRPIPTNHATVEEDVDEYFAQNDKSDEDPHAAKRTRFNDCGDEEPVDEGQAAASSSAPNTTDIDSTFDDLKLRGRTVRRRKTPASPFIPGKPRGVVKAVVRKSKPRHKPVFGAASLVTADEEQLVNAIKKKGAQVTVVKHLNGLPKVAPDPTVDLAERSKEDINNAQVPVSYDAQAFKHNGESILIPKNDGEQVPVSSDNQGQMYYDQQSKAGSDDQDAMTHDECVCGAIAEDTQIQCVSCNKSYHPYCIGKGLQDPVLYLDNRRDHAAQDDAYFYRKNRDFTCTDCDNETLAAKKQWAPEELNAEKRRRNKLFAAKNIFKRGETIPRICDSCDQIILNIRFECISCDYDLCDDCFTDPEKSSLHQHSAGDMKVK